MMSIALGTLVLAVFYFSGGESLPRGMIRVNPCEEGAVSWKIVSRCMRPVSNAYAAMIMTGIMNRDTLLSSLHDACSLSWPGFETCAREKLAACGLDETLVFELDQSSMCAGNRLKQSIADLVSKLPEETDVSCVTQDPEQRFQPCVGALFAGGRPQNLFIEENRAVIARRYVGFIQCAVDLVENSSCAQKDIMDIIFTIFGITTAPTGVLVTVNQLENLGILDRNA